MTTQGVPSNRARSKFRPAELFLAVAVVATVSMMIVPLPTWLLDILLATNLSLSVSILLVVLYVPDALAIATFPTVLLLTTLFRLALNVSSSRLILLQANAGEVIRAFGQFVVRGNYVVGAVVFLILTIIQFVVIAKGAERVAEVGARFVLDAMPGKQMAIDGELRSGAIDGSEAKRRRRALLRESQFYGAMDGAMKFVKGDVIASILITVINIVGGLAIGVGQKGMPAVEAVRRYGLLTIGDGLVSQIPALILATGAGVLVTRTASEEPGTPLGEELSRQLFGIPKALRVSAVMVGALALVPGLPAIPFLVIGALLLAASSVRSALIEREGKSSAEPVRDRPGDSSFLPSVPTWSVVLGADLGPQDESSVRTALSFLPDTVFQRIGVPLPYAHVQRGSTGRQVELGLHGIPALTFSLPVDLEPARAGEFAAARIFETLRARAADLIGLSEVQRLVDKLEEVAPAVVRNVVPKPIGLVLLTDILRRLLEEGLSIQNLRAILEALATVGHAEKDPLQLSEYVRAQLKRHITYRLTRGEGYLEVLLVDPIIEEEIRRAITRTPAGAFLTLAPQATRDVLAEIRRAIAALPERGGAVPVFLTQPDIRRFVRKLIEHEFPDAVVTSFAELLPEIALRPIGKVMVGVGP